MFKRIINLILIGMILLSFTFVLIFNTNEVIAKDNIDEKTYCKATLDDEFADNRIQIVLNERSSYDFETYDKNVLNVSEELMKREDIIYAGIVYKMILCGTKGTNTKSHIVSGLSSGRYRRCLECHEMLDMNFDYAIVGQGFSMINPSSLKQNHEKQVENSHQDLLQQKLQNHYVVIDAEPRFVNNRVMIVLTKESSYDFETYDENIFEEYGCINIIDLTSAATNAIRNNEESKYPCLNTDNYKRVLALTLDIKSTENVLRVIDALLERPDIESASPDYYIYATCVYYPALNKKIEFKIPLD